MYFDEYAGDTVFKQFFMDYVKKIGFYNGRLYWDFQCLK